MPFSPRHRLFLLVSIVADVLILDQATKWAVEKNLALYTVKPVLPFFNLTHVLNTGASFGMFQDSNRAFIAVALAVIVLLAFYAKRLLAEGLLTGVGLALIGGGAVGNLVDRFRVGAVIDFLDFHWGNHHWPAFNVADSAICVGVALMFFQNLYGPKENAHS